MDLRFNIACIFVCCFCVTASRARHDYRVNLSNDGPVVFGASITFRADVYKNNVKQGGLFKFKWFDNMHPQHTHEKIEQGSSIWKISHQPVQNKTKTYEVQVGVYEPTEFYDWNLCFNQSTFTLEDQLVGNLVLVQGNKTVDRYVESNVNLQHMIKLKSPDYEYLKLNAANYAIDWFIDGVKNDTFHRLNLDWNHIFPVADVSHTITVNIVADRKNLSESSDSFESSTAVDIISTTNPPNDTKFNNASDPSFKDKLLYSTSNLTDHPTCPETQVCGTFSRLIAVKARVSNVKVAGNNWLKHEDMLNLTITCDGSGPFHFCKRILAGTYKVTGNEVCKFIPERNLTCNFSVNYYFRDLQVYTVLLIISNDINKNVTAFGVNFYEATKHPQLSVVVVPLTASILAIILVIFGVAFYFQNRSSYAIEVADFDFTNNNDLEYKTFKERLVEAIHNAFNKPEDFSEEDSYNGVPSTSNNKKYGSMQ